MSLKEEYLVRQEICAAAFYRPTLWQRIVGRMFPGKHVETPEPDDKVKGHGDAIFINTTCELSFADRLRVLFSGRLAVVNKVATEFSCGNTKANAVNYPLPPRWMEGSK